MIAVAVVVPQMDSGEVEADIRLRLPKDSTPFLHLLALMLVDAGVVEVEDVVVAEVLPGDGEKVQCKSSKLRLSDISS
jgi:hypothetical protein